MTMAVLLRYPGVGAVEVFLLKKLVDDSRLIYKCCSLYYEDGLGQMEICRQLGISRPTVSRLLSMGKKTGVVRIEINNPEGMPYGQLERQVEKAFGLQEVILVPTRPQQGAESLGSPIGNATLKFLNRIISAGDNIGVSMGCTIQSVARADYFVENRVNCTFVPLLGGVSESRMDVHSNMLVQELAERFGGESVQLLAPALFSKREVLESFNEEKSMQTISKLYRRLDIVLMGIGNADSESSTVVEAGYIDRQMMERFISEGAVGDIAMRYFDIKGNTAPYDAFNCRVAGIPLERLLKVPRRVGVASGASKVRPIIGAINGGFINILITDVECAKALMDMYAQ